MKILRAGEVIPNATTNAELLNEVFGTYYKAFMKAAWEYSQDTTVWMVYINGKSHGDNFINIWLDNDTVIQTYEGTKHKFGGIPLKHVYIKDYRLIFEKIDGLKNRRYIFHGLFKYDRGNSTPENLIFKRISKTFTVVI